MKEDADPIRVEAEVQRRDHVRTLLYIKPKFRGAVAGWSAAEPDERCCAACAGEKAVAVEGTRGIHETSMTVTSSQVVSAELAGARTAA